MVEEDLLLLAHNFLQRKALYFLCWKQFQLMLVHDKVSIWIHEDLPTMNSLSSGIQHLATSLMLTKWLSALLRSIYLGIDRWGSGTFGRALQLIRCCCLLGTTSSSWGVWLAQGGGWLNWPWSLWSKTELRVNDGLTGLRRWLMDPFYLNEEIGTNADGLGGWADQSLSRFHDIIIIMNEY